MQALYQRNRQLAHYPVLSPGLEGSPGLCREVSGQRDLPEEKWYRHHPAAPTCHQQCLTSMCFLSIAVACAMNPENSRCRHLFSKQTCPGQKCLIMRALNPGCLKAVNTVLYPKKSYVSWNHLRRVCLKNSKDIRRTGGIRRHRL